MTLILPGHIARKKRPYVDAPTEALLQELLERQEVAELAGQLVLGTSAQVAQMQPGMLDTARQQAFMQLFAQFGEALRVSDFPFTACGVIPPTTCETVLVKLLVARHPLRPKPAPVPAT